MNLEESAKLDARYRICNKNGKGTWYLQHYEPDIKAWIDLPKNDDAFRFTEMLDALDFLYSVLSYVEMTHDIYLERMNNV